MSGSNTPPAAPGQGGLPGGTRSMTTGGNSKSDGNLKNRLELRSQIRNLVTTAVKDRTGPSFDERLADAVAKKNVQMKASEKEQWRRINDCRDRGHKKSDATSPLAAMKGKGVTSVEALQAQKLLERNAQMATLTQTYWKDRKAMLEKIRNREPLFRLTDIAAGQEELKKAAQKRKDEMKEDERKRWEMLDAINSSVLTKPLLMD